jgi:hypothetical protein
MLSAYQTESPTARFSEFASKRLINAVPVYVKYYFTSPISRLYAQ